jgi:hypothetical protein
VSHAFLRSTIDLDLVFLREIYRRFISSRRCLGHKEAAVPTRSRSCERCVAKGLGADHVLIGPTDNVIKFLRLGSPLDESPACSLYVAVTRARASVAFVHDKPELLRLPVWKP